MVTTGSKTEYICYHKIYLLRQTGGTPSHFPPATQVLDADPLRTWPGSHVYVATLPPSVVVNATLPLGRLGGAPQSVSSYCQ